MKQKAQSEAMTEKEDYEVQMEEQSDNSSIKIATREPRKTKTQVDKTEVMTARHAKHIALSQNSDVSSIVE